MSNLIQPVLVVDTNLGSVAVKLQVDTTREEAETEAAYLIWAAPEEVVFFSATVLMLAGDTADYSIAAWQSGLPVHSVDCDCEMVAEPTDEQIAAMLAPETDKWGDPWLPAED